MPKLINLKNAKAYIYEMGFFIGFFIIEKMRGIWILHISKLPRTNKIRSNSNIDKLSGLTKI